MQSELDAHETLPEGESLSKIPASQHHGHGRAFAFSGVPDPSRYMLGLPKSRPRFLSWFTIAVLAGALLAFGLVFLMNFRM